uniref:Uncharacterized protein n=1 Tax=Arundo donax TaxID=35708 RepID=A0A0A8Y3S8_ARUDO
MCLQFYEVDVICMTLFWISVLHALCYR